MENPKTRRKIPRLQLIGLLVFLAVAILLTAVGIRWMTALSRNPDKLAAFQDWVSDLGIGGWFVLLGIQYVQIVLAFIPGGPIQIAAGALYGPWGGLLVCMTGTVLATGSVFFLVDRYGKNIINLFLDQKDISKYKFLNDAQKLEMLVIILFLIPGTPKDALTYLFALTPISLRRFLLLSTVARLPGVLTSVLAGDFLTQGDWLKAGIMFGILSLVAVAGFFIHRKIVSRRDA